MKNYACFGFALLMSIGLSMAQTVVINEFVAVNDSIGGYQEPDGGYGDWIELYNNTSSPINLTGYNLSDRLDSLDRWTFPAGTIIDANGYLIVWADNDEGQTGIHTNFRLSSLGEEIGLSLNGAIIDQVIFGSQQGNVSEARIPNGTGPFVAATPTPLANNSTLSTRQLNVSSLKAYPSPAADWLFVNLDGEVYRNFSIFDSKGAELKRGVIDAGLNELNIEISELPFGNYLLSLDGGIAIARFIRG